MSKTAGRGKDFLSRNFQWENLVLLYLKDWYTLDVPWINIQITGITVLSISKDFVFFTYIY